MIIDSHCHLHDPACEDTRGAVARLPNLRFRPKHAAGTAPLPAEESIEVVEGATPPTEPVPELQPQQTDRSNRREA